jgi:hypothetical protein
VTVTAAFQRFAGICALLAALGALLYAILFIAIVEGGGETTYEWWFFLLMAGGAVTIPVFAALYLRLAPIDGGFALTTFAFGVLAGFGGIMHGAYNLGRLVTPRDPSIPAGFEEISHGVLRYAAGGIALLLLGWLLSRDAGLPNLLGWLAYLGGALLVFIYVGRLFDFITPGDYVSLLPPIVYGFLVHPLLYGWLGLILWRGSGAAMATAPRTTP